MDRKIAKEFIHIETWMKRIQEIVDRGEESYRLDSLLQEAGDSLMMKIGEAANRLSKLEQAPPDGIDWALAVANRNFIIHEYDLINRETTWFTLSRDLMEWRNILEPLFEEAHAVLSA